jgi:hypothetical protein
MNYTIQNKNMALSLRGRDKQKICIPIREFAETV